jgi:uncharacterized protein YbjT (DUF2867 family)
MAVLNVCILGGTGFVGRAISAQLSRSGHRITIPTRSIAHHRDLLVLPGVVLVDGDVHNPALLRRLFKGMHVVINLIGILNESGHDGRGFQHVHVDLAGKVASACREEDVRRLLHMSALNAGPRAPSHYLRTKAAGDDAARVLRAFGHR